MKKLFLLALAFCSLTAFAQTASIWCETPGVVTAANECCHAAFTINTLPNGNVTIVINATEGTAEGAKFRGNNGMNGTFKLNNSAADFTACFDKALSADKTTVTLSLKGAAPAAGSIIDYSGQIECASSVHGNDWSNYDILGYVYGTTCPTDVAVTGVSLDQTTASVPVNKTLTLKAIIAPNNAANKSVTWSSSVTTIATVADGVVTPVAQGTTVITATTVDGGFTASCTVTVGPAQALAPTTPAPTPTVAADKVMSIYSDTYTPCVTLGNVQDLNRGWWNNPTMTEDEISGNHMLHYTGNMGGMIGWEHAHINIATMNKVHVDIWAQVNGTLTMGPTSADPTVVAEKVLTLVGGQWNSFDLDLATDFNKTLDLTNMFQNQFTGYSAQENLFVDNYFYYTTLDADTEAPVMTSASLESASYTSAILNVAATDNRGVTKYIVKNGATEIGKFAPAADKITVTGLTDGTTYTLSIYAEDAAENVSTNHVEVSVTTLTLPNAAADPDVTNKDYVSVYAPSLTSVLAHDFVLKNWGSADGMKVEAKGYYFYHTTNNATIVWGENNAGANAIVADNDHKGNKGGLDASEMEYMHLDIWADKDGCNSMIVVINDHNLGNAQTLNAGWNSIDIDLTEFSATPDNNYLLDNVAWIKFVGLNNTNDIAVTNVYFWKSTTPTAIDNLETVKVLKTIENGQIVIIKNGVRYNAQGARL